MNLFINWLLLIEFVFDFTLKGTILIQPAQTVLTLMSALIHKRVEEENASTMKVDMNANVLIVLSYYHLVKAVLI